jgi:HlyD family secretion protein
MSGRRRLVILALILVVAAAAAVAGVGWYHRWQRRPSDTLVLQGNVDVREVDLAFEVPGRIDSLAVDEGDRVSGGQVVATLDTGYFEDAVREVRAALAARKSELARLKNGSRPEEIEQARAAAAERQVAVENARRDVERYEQLVKTGGISRQVYDTARATLDQAQAQLRSALAAQRLAEIGPRPEDIEASTARVGEAEASLADAERRLHDGKLVAPGDGIVQTRVRERGAYVNVGETVFSVTLPKPLWVRTYVAEPDLAAVRPGAEAEVTADGLAGKRFRGHVGFVSPVAEFTPKTVETKELRTDLVYRIRVIVDDADQGGAVLRQGMPVTVTLKRTADGVEQRRQEQ